DRDRIDAVEPGRAGGCEHALPDLLGVVLDPPGSREVLRQLRVAPAYDVQHLVDDEARGPGRALVDREDHEWRSANPSVRRHASSDASANSSCLRSKKLCGAPSYVTTLCSTPASPSARPSSALSSAVMPWSAPACSARMGAPTCAARCTTLGPPRSRVGLP